VSDASAGPPPRTFTGSAATLASNRGGPLDIFVGGGTPGGIATVATEQPGLDSQA